MNHYEALYILKPDLEDEAREGAIRRFADIVTANGGEVEEIKQNGEWGKRRLAYPINYIEEGYYVLMTFKAPPQLPAELERNFKISDDVMRYMVVNLDKK